MATRKRSARPPKGTSRTRPMLAVTVDPAVYDTVLREAARQRRPLSWVVEDLLYAALEGGGVKVRRNKRR